MRRILAVVFGISVLLGVAGASSAGNAQSEVAALLQTSAGAWNHGDLDTFMQTYENSPQTVYIGAKSIVRGYAAIREHYVKQYAPGHMGTLSVSDLVVRPLGPAYAGASARWHLARPVAAGGNVSGLFTLVLHRNRDGWHIITDHTP